LPSFASTHIRQGEQRFLIYLHINIRITPTTGPGIQGEIDITTEIVEMQIENCAVGTTAEKYTQRKNLMEEKT